MKKSLVFIWWFKSLAYICTQQTNKNKMNTTNTNNIENTELMTFVITPEIRLEILQGIAECEKQIAKENKISADLRYYDVIERYEKQINHFKNALEVGII